MKASIRLAKHSWRHRDMSSCPHYDATSGTLVVMLMHTCTTIASKSLVRETGFLRKGFFDGSPYPTPIPEAIG